MVESRVYEELKTTISIKAEHRKLLEYAAGRSRRSIRQEVSLRLADSLERIRDIATENVFLSTANAKKLK